MELAMRDGARRQIGLPSLDEITTPADQAAKAADLSSRQHFHVWIEKGWSGTRSPIMATISHANEAVRNLASEPWCAGIEASSSFPFSQVFLKRNEMDADGRTMYLNCTIGACDGRRASSSGAPCNKSATWTQPEEDR